MDGWIDRAAEPSTGTRSDRPTTDQNSDARLRSTPSWIHDVQQYCMNCTHTHTACCCSCCIVSMQQISLIFADCCYGFARVVLSLPEGGRLTCVYQCVCVCVCDISWTERDEQIHACMGFIWSLQFHSTTTENMAIICGYYVWRG
jgi:hypothetical protein